LRTPNDTVFDCLLISAIKLCESGTIVPSQIKLDGDVIIPESVYSELKDITDSMMGLAFD
jgi:hypothetical protein